MRIGRTKETKNLLMEGLQPQHVNVEVGPTAVVQEINALKALEHLAHGGRLIGFLI